MSDPLIRQWQMLRLVPRAPRKASTAMLEAQLADRGFEINRRSIQRDLIKLSVDFPLVCDMRSKPYGWSWARDAAPFDVPGIDMHTALAFHLAFEYMVHLLPATTSSYLTPHVAQARSVLATLPGGALAAWPDQIAVVPSAPPRVPPHIDPDVLEAVHTALLTQRRLDVVYRRRGEEETKRYVANPLGLVYRDAIAYLVCTLREYDDMVQLAVHRMVGADVGGQPSRSPEGFSLGAYVASGAFGFLVGEGRLALKLRVEPNVAVSMIEAPVSADQTISTAPDGWTVVQATVADTVRLRTWLLGLSHHAEVLAPEPLRREIIEATRRQAAVYGLSAP